MQMGYFIMVLCALTLSALIVKKSSLNTSGSWLKVFPVSLFGIIIFLFFAGVIHQLFWGVMFVCIFSAGVGIYLILHRKTLKDLWNWELWILLLIALFFFFAHCGRGLVHGDEYTHWALTVKNMFCTGLLGSDVTSITEYKDYPPATAVLEYMIVKLNGVYREEDLFRGISILSASLLLAMFEPIMAATEGRKRYLWVVIALLSPAIFFYPYTETLVDCLLGLLFSYILCQYMFMKQHSTFDYLSILMATMVLVLTKASGTGLSAIICIIIICDLISSCEERGRKIRVFLGMIASIIIGKLSWSLSLQLDGGERHWDTSAINMESIAGLLKNFGESEKLILKGFILDYIYPQNSLNLVSLSYLTWILIIGVLLYLYSRLAETNKKRLWGIGVGILIGLFIYSFSLLMLYFFVWKAALTEGSLYRYMNTYFMGASFFAAIITLRKASLINKEFLKKNIIAILIGVVLLCRPYEVSKLFLGFTHIFSQTRSIYEEVHEFDIKEDISPMELIVVNVGKDSGAEERKRLNYQYVPYRYYEPLDKKDLERLIAEENPKYVCLIGKDGMEEICKIER